MTITESTTPFAITRRVPCANGGAGEVVAVTGEMHTRRLIVVNPLGELLQVNTHRQLRDITAVGQTTGDKFVGTEVFFEKVTPGDALPAIETFIYVFRLIGPGPDNNSLWHIAFHRTTNANGDVTADADNNSGVQCK